MSEKAPITLRSKPSLRKKAERRLMSTKRGIPEAKPVTTHMPMRLEKISRHIERCSVALSAPEVASVAAVLAADAALAAGAASVVVAAVVAADAAGAEDADAADASGGTAAEPAVTAS